MFRNHFRRDNEPISSVVQIIVNGPAPENEKVVGIRVVRRGDMKSPEPDLEPARCLLYIKS